MILALVYLVAIAAVIVAGWRQASRADAAHRELEDRRHRRR